MRKWMLVVLMMVASTAMAQQLDLKVLDKFESKAKSTTHIDMDEAALKSGVTLLKNEKKDEALAKKSAEGLKGLFLRVYEFAKPGDFKLDELKPILDQLKAPNWASFLRTREENEQTEIWMHRTNGEVDGLLLIAAEANELTVINAIGLKNIGDLSKLKNLGAPTIEAPTKED